MKLEGGCYCGEVRHVAEGEPMLKAQCHCRECQYITGGSPNMFVLLPAGPLQLHQGNPEEICTQRSRKTRDARILRRMRYASGHAANRCARRGFESRHIRRPRPVRHPADGDLHHRQAGLPSDPRGYAEFRAAAETVGVARSFTSKQRHDFVRRRTATGAADYLTLDNPLGGRVPSDRSITILPSAARLKATSLPGSIPR